LKVRPSHISRPFCLPILYLNQGQDKLLTAVDAGQNFVLGNRYRIGPGPAALDLLITQI
jgi:hypothetical protein